MAGQKKRFEWQIHRRSHKLGYIKIGSYEANAWFHIKEGKDLSDKAILTRVKRKLGDKRNPSYFEFEGKEGDYYLS